MAAIGRGRSLKNLRIRGKPAEPSPPTPAAGIPGPCLPLALGCGSTLGRGPEPGLPPLACQRILIGAVCLFRAGRNDSGEENVPLDLTRGNAGGAGPGEGAVLGRSWVWGPGAGADRARDRRGCGSPGPGPPPRTHPPSRWCLLRSPRALPGPWVRCVPWVPASPARDSAQPATLWVPGVPEFGAAESRGGRRELEAVI